MGMLDRYKKKGGFIQLLQLIETSGKQKQEQFLGLIGQENPVWEETIRKKTLTLDRVLGWNDTYLAELFSRIQTLTLASAFHGYTEETVAIVLRAISATEQRRFQMTMQEINPTPAEKATSQMKILSETRSMIAQGILKLDKVDPELIIPENIEEKLAEAGYNNGMAASASVSEGELNFGNVEFKSESKPENKSDPIGNAKSADAAKEIEFLKKRVNQLVNENNMLKHELSVFRNKLEQIRKIA